MNGAMDYQSVLNEVYNEVQAMNLRGRTASYIPELEKIDASKFGIALLTVAGELVMVGDADERFSIQSISKVFTLAMVFPKLKDALWTRVGVEPSGNAFNSLAQLEYENGVPRNPLINAGALVITDSIMDQSKTPFNDILNFINQLIDGPGISFNPNVAESELEHSSRNKALAHFMKSFGNIHNPVETLIDVYCHQCAIEMSCIELAQAFQLFVNHGIIKKTGEQWLTGSQTKRMNAILQTCGFYDEAGEFAFKVGLPGKSGVGGGIVGVLPGKFSVAVWSPGLNKKGNSLKGMHALELLTTRLGDSVF